MECLISLVKAVVSPAIANTSHGAHKFAALDVITSLLETTEDGSGEKKALTQSGISETSVS